VRKIVVVSAGLSVPSSTRLLADRLGDAAERAIEARGVEVEVEISYVELRPPRTRSPTTCSPAFPPVSWRRR